jgi:hypothetical protein
MVDIEYETAKNWDYLGGIYDAYRSLIDAYKNYYLSINHAGDKLRRLHELKANVICYFLMIKVPFESYLETENYKKTTFFTDNKIKFDDYLDISNISDENKLFMMMNLLVDWSQRDGVFKLLVEKNVKHPLLR